MNLFDVVIVVVFVSGLMVGSNLGFLRQTSFSLGVITGSMLSAWVNSKLLLAANASRVRSALAFTLAVLIIVLFVDIFRYVGTWLNSRTKELEHLEIINKGLGALFGGFTVLILIWFISPVLAAAPVKGIAAAVQNSHITAVLNETWPVQPAAMREMARLVKPFDLPQLFVGLEPQAPNATNNSAVVRQMIAASVIRDSPSVVKITGQACGFDSTGSGFYIRNDLVATNAHVISGIQSPVVHDATGDYISQPVWYDPMLDFALVHIPSSQDRTPLIINTAAQTMATPAAILGYPGGGSLHASAAFVSQLISAHGYDIYGRAKVSRDIYSLNADVRPGNSGGPLVDQDGKVIGIVFGHSITQSNVGYALAMQAVADDIAAATAHGTKVVSTQSCEK